jgi:HD-like signal output (HDOD) protein
MLFMHNTKNALAISDLLKGDIQLASPPTIYTQLQKIIEDPNKQMADAADVIETDASLAIRLLKIVNSAFYGFSAQITSIHQAINLIGTKELQNIVLSTIVIKRFAKIPAELISIQDFWTKNLRCALIAQEIERHLNKGYSDSAFICGLLHHIGQLVFCQRLPELTKEIALTIQAMDNPTDAGKIEIETGIIGFNHYQTGAALCQLWNLPEIIIESIQQHTSPNYKGAFQEVVAIIRLADHYSNLDQDWSNIPVNSFNITPPEMGTIIETTHERFEEIFKLFYQDLSK